MRGAILYGPRDVRFEERDAPTIIKPTDAVIRISATCVCGSDLWPFRGINAVTQPTPMGHEYCGIVGEVGSAVTSIKPGQFVIGSFFASDNTCPHCRAGYQTSCEHKEFISTAQAPMLRVPLADGTLVATPDIPSDDLIPSLLSVSDVLGTGWFAAAAANVKPGKTVVVVGDGAVGLLGVLSAKQMGAEHIIAMSGHESRQKLAREFGATDIVTERGNEGVARIKEQHWKLSPRQRVGVVGLGGLGHMAVKLAVARKADVTVFTTSPGKITDARRLGAREAVLSSDTAAMNLHCSRHTLQLARLVPTGREALILSLDSSKM
jgi:threonine dehydrogenase-like Zn-dependent dehydrogenase